MPPESAATDDRDVSPSGERTNTPAGGTAPSGKGFLEETPGNRSAMRLMSVMALVAGVGFGVLTLLRPESGTEGIYITFGFLLAAFAPKTLQKYAEGAMQKYTDGASPRR